MEKQFEAGSVLISFSREQTFLCDSCKSLKIKPPRGCPELPKMPSENVTEMFVTVFARSQASSQKINLLLLYSGLTVFSDH